MVAEKAQKYKSKIKPLTIVLHCPSVDYSNSFMASFENLQKDNKSHYTDEVKF